MRTSLGIWALGSMVTRFVPGGYQPEHAGETTADRVRRAVAGLGDLIDDYEFHYPGELDHDNLDEVRVAPSTATASTRSARACTSTRGSAAAASSRPIPRCGQRRGG